MKRTVAGLFVLLPLLAALPPVDRNKALGVPTAPVQIEIFSDFACPHCKLMHENILPLLMKDYVNAGKVYIVDRAYPLNIPGHEHSREAFAYSVAAARIGKYQVVADALYSQQAAWAQTGNVWGTVAGVLSPTEQKKVQELSKDPGVIAEVESEYQEGVAAGINETPTLIVTAGGKRYPLPNAPDYRLLKSMIDGFLPK